MILTSGLVWVTWIVVCLGAIGIGQLLLRLIRRKDFSPNGQRFRMSLWWGLTAATAIILTWNLFSPLSGMSFVVVASLLLLASILGWIGAVPRPRMITTLSLSQGLLLLGILFGSLAMSVLALGMPINYDTGLYHLGSIGYSHDFGTVSGLANLHDRFGFNSSAYPTAAFLGNGLWSGEGFRLVVGVFMMAMAIDLAVRILQPETRSTDWPGKCALTIGLGLTWFFVLQVHGNLLASPAADAMVVVLVLVASVYLLDALGQSGQDAAGSAATAVVAAALAGSLRPVNWLFWLVVVAVVTTYFWRRGGRILKIAALCMSAVLLILMLVRDALLSGWLLFPMARFPVPVDWRYPTPELTSAAITAWARAPHQPYEYSQTSWQWVVPWLRSLPRDWFFLSLVLLLVAFAVMFVVAKKRRSRLYWACLPALVVLPVWLLSAPDPRFVWGELLVVGVLPISIVLQNNSLSRAVVPVTGFFLIVAVAASAYRGGFVTVANDVRDKPWNSGPMTIVLSVAPPPSVPITEAELVDGTITLEPPSDQCWSSFPMCRPSGSSNLVTRRGSGIESGFKPAIPAGS